MLGWFCFVGTDPHCRMLLLIYILCCACDLSFLIMPTERMGFIGKSLDSRGAFKFFFFFFFSISNSHALDKPHWLWYCNCTKQLSPYFKNIIYRLISFDYGAISTWIIISLKQILQGTLRISKFVSVMRVHFLCVIICMLYYLLMILVTISFMFTAVHKCCFTYARN